MPICPIVGQGFRPPAKGILAGLPGGQTLWLRAEPDNEHDSQAIAVWLRTADIRSCGLEIAEELKLHLAGFGYDLERLFSEPEWHLGYIASTANKKLGHLGAAFREALPADWAKEDLEVQLASDATGQPAVQWEPQA